MKRNSTAVLELLCNVFIVIGNSSNKLRIGTAALINFFCPKCVAYSGAALIRVNTVLLVIELTPHLGLIALIKIEE